MKIISDKTPVVVNITNYLAMNFNANALLAIGASPIMSFYHKEMDDLLRIADSLVINIGCLDDDEIAGMHAAAAAALKYGKPWVIDPVGVGASSWRLRQILVLLDHFRPSVLRVNFGEAQALCGVSGQEQGVDSVKFASVEERAELARRLAGYRHTTVLLTGEQDLVSDGSRVVRISGGSGKTGLVTGCGDMLSVLCGAFAAVEPDMLSAAVLASAFWKCCAADAEAATKTRGIGSFHEALFSAAEMMTAEKLEKTSSIQAL